MEGAVALLGGLGRHAGLTVAASNVRVGAGGYAGHQRKGERRGGGVLVLLVLRVSGWAAGLGIDVKGGLVIVVKGQVPIQLELRGEPCGRGVRDLGGQVEVPQDLEHQPERDARHVSSAKVPGRRAYHRRG